MREHKYRAWDEGNKKMYHDVQFVVSGYEGNDWICFYEQGKQVTSDAGIIMNNPYLRKQIKLMESTGLKDKNGGEIYEGDVINAKGMYNDVIIFEDGGFNLKGGDIDENLLTQLEHYGNYEVISNIYESPTYWA